MVLIKQHTKAGSILYVICAFYEASMLRNVPSMVSSYFNGFNEIHVSVSNVSDAFL
jgi:hypothetical protein